MRKFLLIVFSSFWLANIAWGTKPVFIETASITNPDSKQVYYYQNDHLGTPYKIIDNTSFVVWGAQIESFGQAHLNNNNVIVNNLRFLGQYFDEESGLDYNWRRYYDPALGR
ncbi:MAG: RHS domain-containing protein, partial [Colwellia sp.]|nr:RHS domain-containing protein [Colwellia sp.]MCW8864376.1 RHS domain-containing protein [Colwellia sp.]MCW9080789.1 RHS domain-containing protein [Colwellia sp.]